MGETGHAAAAIVFINFLHAAHGDSRRLHEAPHAYRATQQPLPAIAPGDLG